jgi:hypothetical protein
MINDVDVMAIEELVSAVAASKGPATSIGNGSNVVRVLRLESAWVVV